MIIAVDFDGTCVTHEFPNVGRDIGAAPVLRDLVAAGHQLILWTMRSDGREDGSTPLTDAVNWFARHSIPLLGVNQNPNQKSWTTSPKAYAHLYIDDAAFGAPLIPGDKAVFVGGEDERPYIDWAAVRKALLP
jgi:hypothetical protein